MSEFGEDVVRQTTLASMFPISYVTMLGWMSPRTPQPNTPLSPEKVKGLFISPFSLTYQGNIKVSELNTELTFLSRAICSGSHDLLIDLNFDSVILDDNLVPVVLQGLVMNGSIRITGHISSMSIVYLGYNTISHSLLIDPNTPIQSLELYECTIGGNITLPTGPSLTSILIYGRYPQISLTSLSNTRDYPSLTSMLYLNTIDGTGARDIPAGARGFGAYTLAGLTQKSYPLITTLAVPEPWSEGIDIETLFPNLKSLYVLNFQHIGSFTIPQTSKSRYSSLTIIGASQISSLDLSQRTDHLSGGIRIVGCPQLTGVVLRREPNSEVQQEHKVLIIERCSLLYLRGLKGLSRSPLMIRLGDNINPFLNLPDDNQKQGSRLLDYILKSLPTFGVGSTLSTVTGDYLPNVLVTLTEKFPQLIRYSLIQTVEYQFTRPPAVIATDSTGRLTTSYTQYSGGSNPIVPSTGSSLTLAIITVSPFGIKYTMRVKPSGQEIATLPTFETTENVVTEKHSHWSKYIMIIAIALGLIILGVIIAKYKARKR